MAEKDPDRAIEVLEAMGEAADEDVTALVWTEIARYSPERVKALLDEQDGEVVHDALAAALQGFLGSDLEAGIALLENYPGEEFQYLWKEVIDHFNDTDPRRGVEMPASHFREGGATLPLTGAIGNWLRDDEASAREWARSISDASKRKSRMDYVLDTWKEQDPEAAAAASATPVQE